MKHPLLPLLRVPSYFLPTAVLMATHGWYAFLVGVLVLLWAADLYSTRCLRLEESERLAEYLRGRGWRDVSRYTGPRNTWVPLPRYFPRLSLTERQRNPLLPTYDAVYVPAWVVVWAVLTRAITEAAMDAMFTDSLGDYPETREAWRDAETRAYAERAETMRLAWWSYRHAEDALALLDLGGESAVKAMYDAR